MNARNILFVMRMSPSFSSVDNMATAVINSRSLTRIDRELYEVEGVEIRKTHTGMEFKWFEAETRYTFRYARKDSSSYNVELITDNDTREDNTREDNTLLEKLKNQSVAQISDTDTYYSGTISYEQLGEFSAWAKTHDMFKLHVRRDGSQYTWKSNNVLYEFTWKRYDDCAAYGMRILYAE
jgi:hypothetical protein